MQHWMNLLKWIKNVANSSVKRLNSTIWCGNGNRKMHRAIRKRNKNSLYFRNMEAVNSCGCVGCEIYESEFMTHH